MCSKLLVLAATVANVCAFAPLLDGTASGRSSLEEQYSNFLKLYEASSGAAPDTTECSALTPLATECKTEYWKADLSLEGDWCGDAPTLTSCSYYYVRYKKNPVGSINICGQKDGKCVSVMDDYIEGCPAAEMAKAKEQC